MTHNHNQLSARCGARERTNSVIRRYANPGNLLCWFCNRLWRVRVGCCLPGIQSVSHGHWVDIKLSIICMVQVLRLAVFHFQFGCVSESEELSVTRVRLLLLLTMASLCVDAEQRNKMQRAGALAARASNEPSRCL